jgi:DNA-nicking Smr family endonuclease
VRVEDERVTVDLHGLSDEDAVAVVEDALDALQRPVLVRLITGHGRDRPDGYSLIRVALVRALADRDDVVIDELARHQRHARSDDRLGHVDVRVG